MIQPACDEEGYGECVQQPDPAPPDPPRHSETLAFTFWLALIIGLMLVEIIANRSGRRTPSQVLKRHTGKILKWIGVAGFILLGVHLFFGGPL